MLSKIYFLMSDYSTSSDRQLSFLFMKKILDRSS
nr:MAG TPA: hypothetical protein [Caudoviricetes sp.]